VGRRCTSDLETAVASDRHRGFESHTLRCVMSQDIGMTPNPRARFGVLWLAGWPARSCGGLVAAGGVEVQFAQELAGGGVDDADVQVLG